VRFGGGFISLFFGRRLTWLRVGLAGYNIISRGLTVALYRETDLPQLVGLVVPAWWPQPWRSFWRAACQRSA
jgi:hypothetical protein